MLNTWLRNCRGILAFKGNRGYKERDQKENAWRAVEQFLIFMKNKGPSNTLNGRTIFLLLSLKCSL